MLQKLLIKRNPFDETKYSSKAKYYSLIQKRANNISKNIRETVLAILGGIIVALILMWLLFLAPSKETTYESNGTDSYGNQIMIDGKAYHQSNN